MSESTEEQQIIIDGIAPPKQSRHRKKLLYSSLKDQIEFYFSDVNIAKDRFIAQLLQKDPYVDLSIFLQFNKIRRLTEKLSDLCKAVSKSEILELSDDNTKVRRKTEIRVKENEDECTIYVERLPVDAEHDWLKSIFSKFGPVDYVSIPRYKHNRMIKGFAFIEFGTPEVAQNALKYFDSIGCKLPTTMLPDKLVSISTFDSDKPEKHQNIDNQVSKETVVENKTEIKVENQKTEIFTTHLVVKETRKRKGVDVNDETPDDKKQKSEIQYQEMDSTKKIKHEIESDEPKTLKNVKKETKNRKKGEESTQKYETSVQEKETTIKNEELDESNAKKSSKKERKNKKKGEESAQKHETQIEEMEIIEEIKTEQNEFKTNKNKKEKRKKLEETEKSSESVKNEEQDTNQTIEKEEDLNKGSETNENAEQAMEDDQHLSGEKRKRKRKKNKIITNDLQQYGLKVLSKKEWKQLRNKYLNLQRQKMQSLKEQIYRNRFANNQNISDGKTNDKNLSESNQSDVKTAPRFEFIPGVIVHITLRESFSDIKKFKNDIRAQQGLQYVDMTTGSNVGYIRFSDNASVKKFCESDNINADMVILEGDEEKNYWDKILLDREEKLKRESKKQRGRDKLLRKAEKELGKHIRFDGE